MPVPDHEPAPGAEPPQTRGMPRWVKLFVIAGVLLTALVVVMLATGHGPGRHLNHAMTSIGTVVG